MMLRSYFGALLLSSWAIGPLAAVSQNASASQLFFASNDVQTKRAILRRIGSADRSISPTQAASLLIEALQDTDVAVRLDALGAIGVRAGGRLRFAGMEDLSNWGELEKNTAADKQWTDALRPLVTSALSDGNAQVRRQAIIVLGNMDFNPWSRTIRLAAQTVGEFSRMYRRDADDLVRAELIKGFALIPDDSELIRQTLVEALTDSSSLVRKYGAIGARKLPARLALEGLTYALMDANREVRFEAAVTLSFYGAAARSSLPVLRQVLTQERDAWVREQLEASIIAIVRASGTVR